MIEINKIYLADFFEFVKQVPDNFCDLVVIDPPYLLSVKGKPTVEAGKATICWKGDWDKQLETFEEKEKFHDRYIKECLRILAPQGSIWIMGTLHNIFICGNLLLKNGCYLINDVIWVKPCPPPNLVKNCFTHSHETLLWTRKGKKHSYNYDIMLKYPRTTWEEKNAQLRKGIQMKDTWILSPPSSFGQEMNNENVFVNFGVKVTQKPLELYYRIILSSSNEGDIVFDPFIGSGGSMVAAKQHRRRYFGCENDPKTFAVAEKRLADAEPIPKLGSLIESLK